MPRTTATPLTLSPAPADSLQPQAAGDLERLLGRAAAADPTPRDVQLAIGIDVPLVTRTTTAVERLRWLNDAVKGFVYSKLGWAKAKLLHLAESMAGKDSMFFLARPYWQKETGLPLRTMDRATAELVREGWWVKIADRRHQHKGSHYALGLAVHHDSVLPTTGETRVAKMEANKPSGIPSSSEDGIPDKTTQRSKTKKSDSPNQDSQSQFGDLEENGKGRGTLARPKTDLPTSTAAVHSKPEGPPPQPPPLSAQSDSPHRQALQSIYHPERPPDSWEPGYCRAMLVKYKFTWGEAWAEGIDVAVRWYKNRWPKFLEDLKRHRANELANVDYPSADRPEDDPEFDKPKRAPMPCESCREAGNEGWESKTPPPDPILFKRSGKVVMERCVDCSRKRHAPANPFHRARAAEGRS